MGVRTFLNQLTVDTIQHRTHGIADEIDVSTLKDYMKVNVLFCSVPKELLMCPKTEEKFLFHLMFM